MWPGDVRWGGGVSWAGGARLDVTLARLDVMVVSDEGRYDRVALREVTRLK